jgi:exosortase
MDSAIDAGHPVIASSETRPPEARGLDWTPLIWFSALLLVSYVAVLYALGVQWTFDDDVSHGPFVPVVAGYIAWQRRKQFLDTPAEPNYWGLAIVCWAVLQMLAGTLGAELFLQRTSFIIAIAGMVLLLGGTRILKLAGFPIFLLLFMIPLPKVVYGQITLPLQLFASSCAEQVLTILNIPVLREGNLIELSVRAADGSEFIKTLNVVEACSGIRSLMALSFLGLVYGFFFDSKPWMKWALLATTIPIAITANASRVALTGILTEYNPNLADGFFHMLEGWVIFVVAGIMLFMTHRLINFAYNRFASKPSPNRAEAQ